MKKWIPCVNSCYFCPICERIKGKLQTYIQLAHTLHIGKPSFIDCGKNGSWCLFSSSSHAEESSEKKISTVIGIALLLWHATHKTRKWSWHTGLKVIFWKTFWKFTTRYLVFIKGNKTKNSNFKICTNYISRIIYFPKYGEYHQKFVEIIPLVYFWLVFHMNITKFLLWVIHPCVTEQHIIQSNKRVLTENPFWIKQLTFKCHKSWNIPIHGQWVNGSSNPLTIICK